MKVLSEKKITEDPGHFPCTEGNFHFCCQITNGQSRHPCLSNGHCQAQCWALGVKYGAETGGPVLSELSVYYKHVSSSYIIKMLILLSKNMHDGNLSFTKSFHMCHFLSSSQKSCKKGMNVKIFSFSNIKETGLQAQRTGHKLHMLYSFYYTNSNKTQ